MFYLFILFFIQNNVALYPVKQLDHFQETDSQFSVLLPTPHSYATDFLTGLLASIISP